jgi:hypothetical protein
LKPVSQAYEHYSPEATFHDPIGLAKGLDAVVCCGSLAFAPTLTGQKAQFNAMPSAFSSSTTEGMKVLDNPAVVSILIL